MLVYLFAEIHLKVFVVSGCLFFSGTRVSSHLVSLISGVILVRKTQKPAPLCRASKPRASWMQQTENGVIEIPDLTPRHDHDFFHVLLQRNWKGVLLNSRTFSQIPSLPFQLDEI